MPKAHRVGDQRMCGATTVGAGLNTNVFVNGQLAAVVGDLDSHNMLGALISQSPGTILINGIPMIASIMDQGSPDQIGLITHVTGLPTPGTGSPNVNMYSGSFAGGLGNFGLSGIPAVGELMSFGGNIIGQVYRTANQGSNSGMMALNNMNTNVPQPTYGSTITSANTGKTFTFTSYYYEGAVASGSGLSLSPVAGSLTGGTKSSAYSQTFTASNGNGTYTYSSGGTLPTGLSLNSSTGVLSGTPSAEGSFSFTITATDSLGITATNSYSVSIAAPLVSPGTTTYSNPGTYSFTVPNYNTLSVTVKGGGQGGQGGMLISYTLWTTFFGSGSLGAAGGSSAFGNYITAEGGGINNTAGGSGGTVSDQGGAAGAGGQYRSATYSDYPKGIWSYNSPDPNQYALNGLKGAMVNNSWNLGAGGAPPPGTVITVTVGAAGGGGAAGQGSGNPPPYAYPGGAGGTGSVSITWN